MLRMEVCCFIIIAFIAILYFASTRKRSVLHFTYATLLVTLLIHLVFDGLTVYTVNHRDIVNPLVNDIFHRFFICTMIFVVFLFYMHITFTIEEETDKKLKLRYPAIIYLVIVLFIGAFAPIYYIDTKVTSYSYGPAVIAVYASIFVYLILCIIGFVKYFKNLTSRKRLAIGISLSIEVIVTVLQALNPTWLISGLGFTLMTIAFYLTLDNPDLLESDLVEQKISMLYLKSQINPHFLYNTLDTIRIQAELNDDKEVAHLLMKLVEFFRYTTKVNKQMVTLEDELNLLEAYMELICYRYKNISVSYDIDPEVLDSLVPNFILQPICENSLLHGLKNKGYNGHIEIKAKKELDNIRIQIIDNGTGFTDEGRIKVNNILSNYKKMEKLEGNSVGILNIEKRIKLLCGKNYGLSYIENPDGGLTADILINYSKGEE